MRALVLVLACVAGGCRTADMYRDPGRDQSMPASMLRDMAARDAGGGSVDFARQTTADLARPVVHDFAGITPDMVTLTPCQSATVTTLAGNGLAGFLDGTGGANGTTKFNSPEGIAADAAGNVYVADCNNNRIRKVAPDGSTTTIAGDGTAGFVNGTLGAGGTSEFNCPVSVAVDNAGNLYASDFQNGAIRKITSSTVSTIVSGQSSPWGVAVNGAGTILYFAAGGSNQIETGASATILSGNGTQGFLDSDGSHSEFNFPLGICVDAGGTVYVADSGNNRLRTIAPGGATSTLAGNGNGGFADGTGGPNGSTEFQALYAVAVDGAGNVYTADERNNRIRMTAPNGSTVTIAGGNTSGFVDGQGCTAQFNSPTGIALGGKLLFVSERDSNRIRKIQLAQP